MLAYVFWHWTERETGYEDALTAFHRTLSEHPPEGFLGSRVLRIGSRPWLDVPRAYEDWYFIEDFAALGRLNEAAVSGTRKAPHDASAALALGGTAGVYLFVRNSISTPRFASFRSKSAGVSYSSYLSTLPADAEAWQRQMTLGPAPEFCLLTEHALGDSMPVDLVYSNRLVR